MLAEPARREPGGRPPMQAIITEQTLKRQGYGLLFIPLFPKLCILFPQIVISPYCTRKYRGEIFGALFVLLA
jgi:hypothetical protein